MEWTSSWVGDLGLSQELFENVFVSSDWARDDNFFTSDNDNLLSLESGLGNGGGQSTSNVLASVNNDGLKNREKKQS